MYVVAKKFMLNIYMHRHTMHITNVIQKKVFIFTCNFLRKACSTEQTPVTLVFPFGTQFTAESTEAMRIKCLAQGHNIPMQPGFEPSNAVSRPGLTIKQTMYVLRAPSGLGHQAA